MSSYDQNEEERDWDEEYRLQEEQDHHRDDSPCWGADYDEEED